MPSDHPALAAWKRLEAKLCEEGHTRTEVRYDMGDFALLWVRGVRDGRFILAISRERNSWSSLTEEDEDDLTLAAPFAAEFVTRVRMLNAIAQDPANAVALIDAATKTL